MGSAGDGGRGGGQRGVCVASGRRSVRGNQKMANKSWHVKTQQAAGWSEEGRGDKTDSRLLRISGGFLARSVVSPSRANFNWMSLELQGRTGAAVTVLPHRTEFSVPTDFSSHTVQAMEGLQGLNPANSCPCRGIKGHGSDQRYWTSNPPGLNKELKCDERLSLIVLCWFPG